MNRLVVCAVLVGCGGGGGGDPTDIDNLGMELGVVSCAKMFDCCSDAELMEQFMGITYDDQPITTEEQCVGFTNALFSGFLVTQYKESIASGRIEYDSAAAGDCIAALEELTCAQYSSGNIADISACRPFVIAKVADGGGCTQDYECTSDYCEGATSDTDGMCKPMPTAGQACEGTCADGLYCGFEQSTGMQVCQELKADGAQCNLDRECASDYCDDTARTCATEAPTCDGR